MSVLGRTASSESSTDSDALLRLGAVVFAAFVLFHNGDHARRGLDSVDADVVVAGTLAVLVEVAIVALVYSGHRWAALGAASTGVSLAIGYTVVHVLPGRSWLSDPLFDGAGEGVSQVAAVGLTGGAVCLAVVGAITLRRRGGLASATVDRPVTSVATTFRHPVVAVMAVGNAVLLILSFVG